jgi:hypothetical protein
MSDADRNILDVSIHAAMIFSSIGTDMVLMTAPSSKDQATSQQTAVRMRR